MNIPFYVTALLLSVEIQNLTTYDVNNDIKFFHIIIEGFRLERCISIPYVCRGDASFWPETFIIIIEWKFSIM